MCRIASSNILSPYAWHPYTNVNSLPNCQFLKILRHSSVNSCTRSGNTICRREAIAIISSFPLSHIDQQPDVADAILALEQNFTKTHPLKILLPLYCFFRIFCSFHLQISFVFFKNLYWLRRWLGIFSKSLKDSFRNSSGGFFRNTQISIRLIQYTVIIIPGRALIEVFSNIIPKISLDFSSF